MSTAIIISRKGSIAVFTGKLLQLWLYKHGLKIVNREKHDSGFTLLFPLMFFHHFQSYSVLVTGKNALNTEE